MKKVNDIRTGRHCVFLLHAHLVFVTKYRYGVFTKAILDVENRLHILFERGLLRGRRRVLDKADGIPVEFHRLELLFFGRVLDFLDFSPGLHKTSF